MVVDGVQYNKRQSQRRPAVAVKLLNDSFFFLSKSSVEITVVKNKWCFFFFLYPKKVHEERILFGIVNKKKINLEEIGIN